jgi:uncharacterized protein
MAVGLVGTIVPMIPGLPLIWAAAFSYGAIEGFDTDGIIAIAVISFFLVVGVVSKYVLAHRRATGSGAPGRTIASGALLGFVGFFVIPVVGFFAGAALGVLLAERRRLHDWTRAWDSLKGVAVAFGIGVLIEMAAGAAMIAGWALWVWGPL